MILSLREWGLTSSERQVSKAVKKHVLYKSLTVPIQGAMYIPQVCMHTVFCDKMVQLIKKKS